MALGQIALPQGGHMFYISSVRSQNLVTLIFTKTTFCQRGDTKHMAHILSISCSSRSIGTPFKKHQSCFKIFFFFFFLPLITLFSPSSDIQGVGEGHPPACLTNYKYGILMVPCSHLTFIYHAFLKQ